MNQHLLLRQISPEWSGSERCGAAEFAFYGDAQVVGELPVRFQGVEIVSARNWGPSRHSADYPIIFARLLDEYDPNREVTPEPPPEEGNHLYTGCAPDEELAALVSLALGTRCRSGGMIRTFSPRESFGTPFEAMHARPALPPPSARPTLPRHFRMRIDLADVGPYFESFSRLNDAQAVTLIRAARSYQLALWVAEDDQNLAWLWLVACAEAAAAYWWRRPKSLPALREVRPDFMRALEELAPPQAVKLVADTFGHLDKSALRFAEFLQTWAGSRPPAVRPSLGQVDWQELKPELLRVYELRSNALHAGVPFPLPASQLPFYVPSAEGPSDIVWHNEPTVPVERLPGVGAHAQGATWQPGELPMMLHTFAYLVREAVVQWWSRGCPRKGSSDAETLL